MPVDVDVTKESGAVFVNVAVGESLVYRVTARAAQPMFTLVDSQTKDLLMSQDDNPVQTQPNVVFEREWPLPTDQILQVTSHTMGFEFLDGPTSYRYEVIKKRLIGSPQVIMDITYSSSTQDSHFQDLQVSTV
jgi:hypothetical protein